MALEPRPRKKVHDVKPRKTIKVAVADRYQAFVNGELTVEDLDDEEIYRGQIRNKNGDFRGRPANYIPRVFATAIQQEAAKRFSAEMSSLVPDAIKAIQEVMQKKHPQPGDGAKVQAAFKTIERFAGKVPETVNLKAEIETWEKNVADVVVVYEEGEQGAEAKD